MRSSETFRHAAGVPCGARRRGGDCGPFNRRARVGRSGPASAVPALFLVAALLVPDRALALEPLVLEPGQPVWPLGTHLEYLEDAAHQWSIDEVSRGPASRLFVRSKVKLPSFGFSASRYWFRFALAK